MVLALLCGLLPAFAEETVTEKTVPLYLGSMDSVDEIHLTFLDGNEEIPYVTAEEMCRLLMLVLHDFSEDDSYQVTLSPQGVNALLVRDNGSDALIDFENGEISFGQYDLFTARSGAVNPLDIVVFGGSANKDAEDIYLIRHENTFALNGNYTDLDLKGYGIPTPVINGTGYLPLQTFSDMIIAPSGVAFCWNGQIVIMATSGALTDELQMLTPLGELYYSAPVHERSEALVEFNLNELCLALDFHYGLKEEHGIDNFRDYFIRSGLVTDLTNPDAKVSSAALNRLCLSNFADGHSSMLCVSPCTEYGGDEADLSAMSVGIFSKIMNIMEYSGARQIAYPDGMPAYEEVGNTAYITFDTFTMNLTDDYYTMDISGDCLSEEADTLELLVYAGRQIHRENSPIENVVIDLSCNIGGMFDVAVSVCSWILGSSAMYIQDAESGAQSTTLYTFDGNLSHVFNESEDNVSLKNIFCLISPNSFSCGNLVPAAFRSSGKVTLLGKPSTGGACAVQILSTADGSVFCVSGRYKINTCTNGTLYSVDAGVEPHYFLPKASMFYDRQKLTDYINSLIW